MAAPTVRPASPSSAIALVPIASLLVALVGLAASAASLADMLAPAPAFCAAGGCATVRASAWAKPLGIPLPALGLAFFTAAAAAVALGDRARWARRGLGLAGAAGALGFIALQAFVIGAWCHLCLVADVAGLAYAALAWAGGTSWPTLRGGRGALVLGAAAVAVATPLLLGSGDEPTMVAPSGAALPEVVAREQRPGEVVIVDFIDFQCPHCRDFHHKLTEAIAKAGVTPRVVRKMVPLPSHTYAMTAALAYRAAEAQGKGDAMAEKLIAQPVDGLTAPGCEKLAAEVGLDLARFRADAAAPEQVKAIEAEVAEARAIGLRALPTVYINDQPFVGAAASVDELARALTRAAGR